MNFFKRRKIAKLVKSVNLAGKHRAAFAFQVGPLDLSLVEAKSLVENEFKDWCVLPYFMDGDCLSFTFARNWAACWSEHQKLVNGLVPLFIRDMMHDNPDVPVMRIIQDTVTSMNAAHEQLRLEIMETCGFPLNPFILKTESIFNAMKFERA